MYENNVILRTDDRPTSHFVKFRTAISRERVIRSTSCLVLGRVFEVGGSNGPTSGWTKSKMAAGRHLGKFRMAISLQRIIRWTSFLILGWGFRGRRIEWRYFRLDQIQDGGWPPSWKISNGHISGTGRPIDFMFGSRAVQEKIMREE